MFTRVYLALLFLLPAGIGHALYNGNPAFPMMPENGLFLPKNSWLGIKAGYEWDDIFNRKMNVREHHPHLMRRVEKYAMMGNTGVVTLGISDRVEMYGTMGVLSTHVQQHPYSHTHVKYATESDFAWSIGGRVILAYWGDTQFGIDSKYFQTLPAIRSIHVNGSSLHAPHAEIHYSEWQIGMGVSHRIKIFFPYIGLKYSDVQAKFLHLKALEFLFPKRYFILKNRTHVGLFLGLGLAPEKGFNCNFELRLFDETALTLSSDIRF